MAASSTKTKPKGEDRTVEVQTTLGVFNIQSQPPSDDPGDASITAPPSITLEVPDAEISVWQVLLPTASAAATNSTHGSTDQGKYSRLKKVADARKNDVERRLKKMLAVGDGLQCAVRGRQRYSQVKRIIANSGVVTTVKAGKGGDPDAAKAGLTVSYRHQGNVELYSSLNIRRREENRRHADVVAALDQIWRDLPKMPGDTNRINKSIYTWFNRKLFFALVPNATEKEFSLVNAEDWKNDSMFTTFMSLRAFHTAMFNLADIWCETVEPSEYRDFLKHCNDIIKGGEKYRPPQKGSALEMEDQQGDDDMEGESQFLQQLRGSGLAVENSGANAAGHLMAAPYAERRKSMSVVGYALPEDAIAGFLKEEEKLDEALLATETRSWVEVAQQFFDAEFREEEISEDGILMLFQFNRRKREKSYGELRASDRVALQEKRFIEYVREQSTQRVTSIQALAEKLNDSADQRDTKVSQQHSFAQRRAQRLANHQTTVQEQKETFALMLDNLNKANVRFREERRECNEIEGMRIMGKLKITDPYDTTQQAYLRLKMGLLEHQAEAREDLNDNIFKEFVNVAQNLREAREVLLWHVVDPPHDAILGEDVASDAQGEDIQLGSHQWNSACKWFDRLNVRYNESIEVVMESIASVHKTLKTKETKHHAWILEWHGKLRDTVLQTARDDPCLHEPVKQRRIDELNKFFADMLVNDQREVAALAEKHKNLNAELSELFSNYAQYRRLQERAMSAWKNGITIADVIADSKPFFEFLDEGRTSSTLEETMFTAAKLVGQRSVNFSEVDVADQLSSPVNLFVFAVQLQFSWFGFHFERITSERHRLYHDFAVRMQRLEGEEVVRLADIKLQVRLDRVEDLDHYKQALAMPKCPVGFLAKEIMRGRLEQRTAINEALNKTKSWHDDIVAKTDTERTVFINEEHERRIRIAKLFAARRVHREEFATIAAQQFRIFEQRHFLDLHKLHKIENFDPSKPAAIVATGENIDAKIEAARKRREAQQAEIEAARARDRERQQEMDRLKALSRQEIDQKRNQELKRQAMAEKEKQQRERLRKEKEDKAKWQQQFLEEEAKRLKAEEARRAWSKYETERRRKEGPAKPAVPAKPGTATTPHPPAGAPPVKTAVSAPAAKESHTPPAQSLAQPQAGGKLRRKSTGGYNPVKVTVADAPPAPAAGTAAKPPMAPRESASPAARVRAAIKDEQANDAAAQATSAPAAIAKSVSMAATAAADEFVDRRLHYLLDNLSNADVYRDRCAELQVAPDAPFHASLSTDPLNFNMVQFRFADRPANVATLLDIIRLNPVQRVFITNAGLTDADVKHIVAALKSHEFLAQIDLSGNADLTVVAAQALIGFASANRRILKIKLDDTSFFKKTLPPTNDKMCIAMMSSLGEWLERNRVSQSIGRREMRFLRTMFDAMDKDGSGLVSLEELRAFQKTAEAKSQSRKPATSPQKSSPETLSAAASPKLGGSGDANAADAIEATIRARIDGLVDKLLSARRGGDGEFSFVQFIGFLFPFWSAAECADMAQRFEVDGSNASPRARASSPASSQTGYAAAALSFDQTFDDRPSAVTDDQHYIAEMKAFFEEFASKDTHVLSLADLARGLGDTEANLEAAFMECDIDGDGVLTLEEFLSFMSAME